MGTGAASRADAGNGLALAGGRHLQTLYAALPKSCRALVGRVISARSDGARRRDMRQRERTGRFVRSRAAWSIGRPSLVILIGGCGRLAVHGFSGRVLHVDVTR